MMEIDRNLWNIAYVSALKVDFLENIEEFRLYASSLYLAMKWGERTSKNRKR